MSDDSPIKRLDDTLYSPKYKPMQDVRTPIPERDESETQEDWRDPSIDDMLKDRRQTEYKPTKLKKFFLASILVFIAAFAVAAYVYLGGGNFISSKNVDIKITGPSAVSAGDSLVLSVTVVNGNNADLEGGVLSIQYPDGTRAADDQSKVLTRDRADLGTVKAGGEATQTFKSSLFGEKGTVLTLKLSLQYKVKGSSATFYKDKTYDVALGDTPVALGVSKPATVTSGDNFTMSILVAANSSDVVKDVIVRAEYPYGYTPVSANPSWASGQNIWVLGDLSPGDKKTITLTGSLEGVDQDERTFRFYAGIADPNNQTNIGTPLVSTSETVGIARPSIGLSISMGGDTEGDYVAPAGTPVLVTLRYQNNSTDKLTRPILAVRLTGQALDKFSIRPQQGGFYDSNSGLITWQTPQSASPGDLAPGDTGQVNFSFASQKSLPAGSQAIGIEASLAGTPPGSNQLVKATASRSVKIASEVSVTGKALYSRGPFTNTGPIPPKAGATTTYSVVLDLADTQNDVTGTKVTMRLGPNVFFMPDHAGAEAIAYDADTNTVAWNVGTLASGTGFTDKAREAVFQVALRPSIGQIGTAPVLVSNIALTGTDSFTQGAITAETDNITTRLTSDPKFVQGDEKVVK